MSAQKTAVKHPETDAQKIARLEAALVLENHEKRILQEALGAAEAGLSLEKQKQAFFQNVNADFGDLFKANHKWAVSFRAAFLYFLTKFWIQALTIDNAYKIATQRKWPPWYVVVGVIFLFAPVLALLVYPPYAIGFGDWLQRGYDGVGFFVLVFFVLFIVFVAVLRRGGGGGR